MSVSLVFVLSLVFFFFFFLFGSHLPLVSTGIGVHAMHLRRWLTILYLFALSFVQIKDVDVDGTSHAVQNLGRYTT